MNPAPIVEAGMQKLFTEFNNQVAGAVRSNTPDRYRIFLSEIVTQVAGGRNQGAGTISVAIQTIKDGRKLRLQPFNNYRKRFGLEPYKSFEDFTGNIVIITKSDDAVRTGRRASQLTHSITRDPLHYGDVLLK